MDKFIIKSLKVDKFIIKVDEFIAKDVCVKKVLRGRVCYYLNPQVDEFDPLRGLEFIQVHKQTDLLQYPQANEFIP